MSAEGARSSDRISGQRTEWNTVFALLAVVPPCSEFPTQGREFLLSGERNMQAVLSIVQKINFYLSDYILVILLVGTGIFFSIKTRFVQVRCFGEGMRSVFGKISLHGGKQESGLSSFQGAR